MHRKTERLAFDIPEGEVQGSQRMRLLTSRRVEPGDVCFLPERLGPERILSNQGPGTLLERLPRTAFTDSCDPDVGLDRYHHVALIEERIEVRRSIDSHARDLCLRQIGRCARRTKQTDGRCGR